MNRWGALALGRRLRAQARRVVREERGLALMTQLVGLFIGISVLGTVTVVFDAAVGVSKNSEAATVSVQRAQNGLALMVNTLTDAVVASTPVRGTAKIVIAQVPEAEGGFRVVRFCLQTGGANGGMLYEQMVYESTIDSSSFLTEGLFSACPDSTWIYNGAPSAIVVADRLSNYQGSPTHPVFTYLAASSGGRRSLAIDLFVTPQNAPAATELTGSVTPRLQVGPG